MQSLSILLFGPPRISFNDKILETGTSKAIALFAYLAVSRQRHTRETLATLLWPHLDQKHAYSALRTTLWKIRKASKSQILEIRRDSISLKAASEVYVDVWEFLELLETTSVIDKPGCPHAPTIPCSDCIKHLQRAVSIYSSGFMIGFSLRDSRQFDQWQIFQSEELRIKLENVLRKLVNGLEQQGLYEQAIHFTRLWIETNHYQEDAHQHLISLLIMTGQRSAAHQHYLDYSRELEMTQGTNPLQETVNSVKNLLPGSLWFGPHATPHSPRFILFLTINGFQSGTREKLQKQLGLLTAFDRIVQEHGGQIALSNENILGAYFFQNSPLKCALAIQDWATRQSGFQTQTFIHLSHSISEERIGTEDIQAGLSVLEASWEGQILISDEAIHAADIPYGTVLKNLGIQMIMKDSRPLHVYSLSPESIRDLNQKSLPASTPPVNVPAQTTPFIGRTAEVLELTNLLDDPVCRLLTLVGTGGTGKTRLSIEVGNQCARLFQQGVFFISLVSINSPEMIIPSIASVLNFHFFKSKGSVEDDKMQLFNFLREKHVLLILDNFEHLVLEAGLLAEILENAPRVKILVTSREQLNLRGEWVFPLSGLDFPEKEDISNVEEYNAVKLLIAGARRVRTGFQYEEVDIPHIVRICRLLHGLPLGLELASTWVQSHTLAEIANEIQINIDFLVSPWMDLPARQRSLRVVLDNTWTQLSQLEKTCLKRLSVFRNGIPDYIFEQCMVGTRSVLIQLSDRSLLRRMPDSRYEMLEVLRLFISEKLEENPEEKNEARKLHCRSYAALVREKWGELYGPDQKTALIEIDQEIENIRVAWAWAVENKLLDEIEMIGEGLFRYYDIRGLYRTAEKTLSDVIEFLGGKEQGTNIIQEQHGVLLGKLLLQQAMFCRRLGFLEKGSELLYYACKTVNCYQDPYQLARCQQAIGVLAIYYCSYELAAQFLVESTINFKNLQKDRDAAISLLLLGTITASTEESLLYYRESLVILRSIGDFRAIGACLNKMANTALIKKDAQEAKKLAEESLLLAQDIGDRNGLSSSLANLGYAHELLGEYEEAVRCYETTLEIFTEMGVHHEIIGALILLGRVAIRSNDIQKAKGFFYLAFKRISSNPFIFSSEVAQAILGTAILFQYENRFSRSTELVAHVIKNKPVWQQVREEVEELCNSLANELSSQVFEKAWARGESLTIEEMISEINQELVLTQQGTRIHGVNPH